MHDCAAVDEELARLRDENEQLRARVAQLETRLSEIEPVLRKATAALTRAEAGLFAKPGNHKQRSNKPGPKEGHEAHHRAAPRVDEEKDVVLTQCPQCRTRLGDAIETRDRVVEGIVPARIHVTRYRVHRYWCPTCKAKVEADPPGVLPDQRFGLRLMLLVAFLRTLGLSWGKTRAYFGEAFGLRLSHGALVHMEHVVSEALGPLYEELRKRVRDAKSVHADDTSWRINGENHWLWVFLSDAAAVYAVEATRGRRAIQAALGEDYAGVVVTDLYPGFRGLPYESQKCLVHVLREIHRFEKKPDFKPGREWTRVRMRVRRLVTEAVAGHENVRDHAARCALKARLVARARALSSLPRRHKYARTLAGTVGLYAESLFTFLDHDGVHWENNPAERGLRPMVVNRKTSFGSRSDVGARRRCVLQSVAETAHLRGTSFHALAGDAIGLLHQESMPRP